MGKKQETRYSQLKNIVHTCEIPKEKLMLLFIRHLIHIYLSIYLSIYPEMHSSFLPTRWRIVLSPTLCVYLFHTFSFFFFSSSFKLSSSLQWLVLVWWRHVTYRLAWSFTASDEKTLWDRHTDSITSMTNTKWDFPFRKRNVGVHAHSYRHAWTPVENFLIPNTHTHTHTHTHIYIYIYMWAPQVV